jgi:hypothetical protein
LKGNIIQSLNRERKRELNNNKYIAATYHRSKGKASSLVSIKVSKHR